MTIVALLVAAVMQAGVVTVPVAQGSQSGIEEPRTVVVRTPAAWRALWKEHSRSAAPAATVDFRRFMVVGVFLGTRPTAGYAIEIASVSMREDIMLVEYREVSPDAGDITAQVLTSPFQMVRVPRFAGEVEFRAAR